VVFVDAGVRNTTPVAAKVSDKEFQLSISRHQEGQAKCQNALDAIADAEAAQFCGQAPHRVTGGAPKGKLIVAAEGGTDRQGSIDADCLYTIQCGNAA
jgi:hypothetical protein